MTAASGWSRAIGSTTGRGRGAGDRLGLRPVCRPSIPDSTARPERRDPSCRLCRHNRNDEGAMNRIHWAAGGALAALASACGGGGETDSAEQQTTQAAGGNRLFAQGRHIFRFDTFGDEAKWTDTLRL